MNPGLKKELRPLLPPWVAALSGALLVLLIGQQPDIGQFLAFLAALGGYAFFGGVALIGSSAFGIELQHRTLSLLLTQPADRARIWRQKMLLSGLAILSLAVLGGVALGLFSLARPYARPPLVPPELAFVAVFLLATACSCGFWTIGAGSTLGGVAFTMAAQFATGLSAVFIVSRIIGRDLQEREVLLVLVVTGLVYSTVFLWLGRRQFVRLELKAARFGEGVPASGTWALNAPKILVSRAEGKALNLVRKEVRLQKPLLQLAAVFVACWLATFLFQWFRPKQNINYLFDVVTCIYAPLGCLLAGCVSLGEEKALGLSTAQLTLPFSWKAQWLIKLSVGAGTAAVVCLGVPLFLFWSTSHLIDLGSSGLMNSQDNGFLGLSALCGLVFLLGFWAISLFANTVRAALVAVFGLIAVGACAALGAWCGQQNNQFELTPLVALMCHLQLPPDDFRETATRGARVIAYSSVGGIVLVCLLQSLLQFRHVQAPARKILACSLTLAVLVTGLSFWSIDFFNSACHVAGSSPVQELRSALAIVAARQPTADGDTIHTVSQRELGTLSPLTGTWLRQASISYRLLRPTTFKNGYVQHNYWATVAFPNGRTFQFEGGYSANPFRR